MLSGYMHEVYRILDRIVAAGGPEEELAVHLIHEIDDYVGRDQKSRFDSIRGSADIPSATSTSTSTSRKTK